MDVIMKCDKHNIELIVNENYDAFCLKCIEEHIEKWRKNQKIKRINKKCKTKP